MVSLTAVGDPTTEWLEDAGRRFLLTDLNAAISKGPAAGGDECLPSEGEGSYDDDDTYASDGEGMSDEDGSSSSSDGDEMSDDSSMDDGDPAPPPEASAKTAPLAAGGSATGSSSSAAVAISPAAAVISAACARCVVATRMLDEERDELLRAMAALELEGEGGEGQQVSHLDGATSLAAEDGATSLAAEDSPGIGYSHQASPSPAVYFHPVTCAYTNMCFHA